MKRLLSLAAIAALGLSGCSNDEVIETVTPTRGEPIAFEAYVPTVPSTRAAVEADATSLQATGFTVAAVSNVTGSAYGFTDFFSYQTSAFAGTTTHYWPFNSSETLTFYAYYNATSTQTPITNGSVTVATVDGNTDLMAASSGALSAQTAAVSLAFDHILTEVLVKVQIAAGITGATVSSITLDGPNGGSYDITNGRWTTSGTGTYTLLSTATALTNTMTSVGENLMVIPAIYTLTFVYTDTTSHTLTSTIDLSNAATYAGKRVTLNLAVGELAIAVNPTVGAWANAADLTPSLN